MRRSPAHIHPASGSLALLYNAQVYAHKGFIAMAGLGSEIKTSRLAIQEP